MRLRFFRSTQGDGYPTDVREPKGSIELGWARDIRRPKNTNGYEKSEAIDAYLHRSGDVGHYLAAICGRPT
jgi:hypothetical protein